MTVPKLTFREIDPLGDYYEDRDGNRYSVARLVDETKNLEPFELPLAGLCLSDRIWNGANIFDLAFHVKRCNEADLDIPIILDWRGDIADGRHRVIRAIVEGRLTIKAVRMTWTPEPCRPAS